nr:hypothetical protein [Anaerolineae bacterium]
MTIPTTINFPVSIDDENTFLGFPVDSQSFTLSIGVDGVSTSITVSEDCSGINVPYLARFQSGEFVYITAKDNGTKVLTVERGVNGTSATSHDGGEVLRLGLTAPQYNQLIRGIENLQSTLGVAVSTSGSAAGTVAGRIAAIEDDVSALGTSPEGSYADVAARLTAIEGDIDTAESDISTIEGTLGTSPEGSFDDVAARLDDLTINSERLIASQGSTLTISSGAITVGGAGWYRVEGEGAAADTLSVINGGSKGDIVVFSAYSGTVTITLEHSYPTANGIFISYSEADILLSANASVFVSLIYNGTFWEVLNANTRPVYLGFTIGNGTDAIASGSYCDWPMAPSMVVTGIYGVADASGSGQIDVFASDGLCAPAVKRYDFDFSSQQTVSSTGKSDEYAASSWRVKAMNAFTTIKQVSVVIAGWTR